MLFLSVLFSLVSVAIACFGLFGGSGGGCGCGCSAAPPPQSCGCGGFPSFSPPAFPSFPTASSYATAPSSYASAPLALPPPPPPPPPAPFFSQPSGYSAPVPPPPQPIPAPAQPYQQAPIAPQPSLYSSPALPSQSIAPAFDQPAAEVQPVGEPIAVPAVGGESYQASQSQAISQTQVTVGEEPVGYNSEQGEQANIGAADPVEADEIGNSITESFGGAAAAAAGSKNAEVVEEAPSKVDEKQDTAKELNQTEPKKPESTLEGTEKEVTEQHVDEKNVVDETEHTEEKVIDVSQLKLTNDPLCNSEELRQLMQQNIDDNLNSSKRLIQLAAEAQFGGRFDVICANGDFSYVTNTELYCQETKGDISCYTYRQL